MINMRPALCNTGMVDADQLELRHYWWLRKDQQGGGAWEGRVLRGTVGGWHFGLWGGPQLRLPAIVDSSLSWLSPVTRLVPGPIVTREASSSN